MEVLPPSIGTREAYRALQTTEGLLRWARRNMALSVPLTGPQEALQSICLGVATLSRLPVRVPLQVHRSILQLPRPEKSPADQSWELQQRFKQTGVVPPQIGWVPKPTAGDMVRALEAEITGERDASFPAEVAESERLWNHPQANRRAPHGNND